MVMDELLAELVDLADTFEDNATGLGGAAAQDDAAGRSAAASANYAAADAYRKCQMQVHNLAARYQAATGLGYRLTEPPHPLCVDLSADPDPPATHTTRESSQGNTEPVAAAIAGAIGVLVDVVADLIRKRPT